MVVSWRIGTRSRNSAGPKVPTATRIENDPMNSGAPDTGDIHVIPTRVPTTAPLIAPEHQAVILLRRSVELQWRRQ
jgi:hypothetical protein